MPQGTTTGVRPDHAGDHGQPGASILLVDDDEELCELLQEFFARRKIRLETVNDGRRGLARALCGEHDLLLLDVMMPGLDGFELLRLVRRQSQVPVIMLTARTTQADRVAGLDAGADDYLPKPFGTEELMARIRAVLRRAVRAPGKPISSRPEKSSSSPRRGRSLPWGPRSLSLPSNTRFLNSWFIPRAESSRVTSSRRRYIAAARRNSIARSTCTYATCGRSSVPRET